MISVVVSVPCALIGVFFLVLGAADLRIGGSVGGALIGAGICFLLVLLWPVLTYIVNRKKDAVFGVWVGNQEFHINRLLGGVRQLGMPHKSAFILDTVHKTWGCYCSYKIFPASAVESAEIHKNGAVLTQNAGMSSGKVKFHGSHAHIKGMNTSSSVTRDTSTYDVHIQTNVLDCPLVVIPCGKNFATAQNICSHIRLLQADKEKEAE